MNNHTDKVKELHIIKKDENIFSFDSYVVPLYQRGYAWEEKHIVQLIDDVLDIPAEGNYYIGSLIVHRKMDIYEVIDGQQRLTTLFLLLQYLHELKTTEHTSLQFECRDKSNYTLKHISDIHNGISLELIDDRRIQQELLNGFRIIEDKLKSIDETVLKNNLRRTIIYRIEVPEHTDLNHYFELMNTRGEQLEQSDVLKARLMARLQGDQKWQNIFATIWGACRNMDSYVQMNFTKELREEIFGGYWNDIPGAWLKNYQKLSVVNGKTTGQSIKEVINNGFKNDVYNAFGEDDQKRRFESIINFPYFLLHTLRVYVHSMNITSKNNLIDTMLDDKKLVEAFERVINQGEINGQPIKPECFVKYFIICLLRTRYLFDKYIIKREFIGESSQDGEWSLKEMVSSGQGGKKKAHYRLSRVVDFGCRYNEEYNKEVLMLQAAMRVSYTSPKVMHWITKLLIWLSDYFDKNLDWEFIEEVNDVVKKPIIEFLNDQDNLYLGVATPHIVLNYLDYLLWKDNKDVDFDFEFRNSVEHWYPRHPSEGSFDRWEDDGAAGVNRFGNLCLIQRNVNSKFSNLHPSAKKSTFQEMISKGSLKLRKMSQITTDNSLQWREETCKIHEEEMINILRQACKLC